MYVLFSNYSLRLQTTVLAFKIRLSQNDGALAKKQRVINSATKLHRNWLE